MKYNARHVVTAIVAVYFFYYASTSTQWHFIDMVNLIFHEAGHTITFLFGQFISVASGSLFQVLIPMLCCFYFLKRGEKYAASLLLFWVGQNVISVSVYARDSIEMQLPLLGGDSVIHDWNYLLSTMGILKYTPYVADTLYAVGIIVFIFALVCSIRWSKD